jgi:hypothetical protein
LTSFTFSAEQLKSAPPEVREWIVKQMTASLLSLAEAQPERPPQHAAELAACTPEEAARLFAAIREDFVTAQVFLELARERPTGSVPPFFALSIAELSRQTRLSELDCFQVIDIAFREIRDDREAALSGFDERNRVYLHEATYRSIRRVWEELALARMPELAASPAGFVPPRVGPSEDILAHQR